MVRKMKPHICERNRSCTCHIFADEPSEDCPVHSFGEWPPRCCICGRFMPWPKIEEKINEEKLE